MSLGFCIVNQLPFDDLLLLVCDTSSIKDLEEFLEHGEIAATWYMWHLG